LTNYQQFEDQSIQYFETLFEFMSIYFDFAPENHSNTFNTVAKSLGSNVKIIKKFLSFMVRENLESENFEKIFLGLVENALKEETSEAEFVEIFSLWGELQDLFGLLYFNLSSSLHKGSVRPNAIEYSSFYQRSKHFNGKG
jgi:hypothetical protein